MSFRISCVGKRSKAEPIKKRPRVYRQAQDARGDSTLILVLFIYTLTLKSLSASFRLVFKSVLGLRWPIIRAQPTPNSPAGNFLV